MSGAAASDGLEFGFGGCSNGGGGRGGTGAVNVDRNGEKELEVGTYKKLNFYANFLGQIVLSNNRSRESDPSASK